MIIIITHFGTQRESQWIKADRLCWRCYVIYCSLQLPSSSSPSAQPSPPLWRWPRFLLLPNSNPSVSLLHTEVWQQLFFILWKFISVSPSCSAVFSIQHSVLILAYLVRSQSTFNPLFLLTLFLNCNSLILKEGKSIWKIIVLLV